MQTQEIWSFLVPAAWLVLFATPGELRRLSAPANAALMAMFLIHYFNRDFIYPLRQVPRGLPPWQAEAFFARGRALTPTLLSRRASWPAS
jgi:hypothetical protein